MIVTPEGSGGSGAALGGELARIATFGAVLAGIALVALGVLPRAALAGFVESAALLQIADGDSMSYAAGFADFDGDGDPDFYANHHWKSDAELWRNDGTVFRQAPSHFAGNDRDRHDQIWGDFDNDGDLDQYLVHGRDQDNELFLYRGFGVFEDVAASAGVADSDGRGRECALADFDGDGWLDLFVVNDLRAGFTRPSRLFRNAGGGSFTTLPNDGLLYRSRWHVSAADWDGDGDPDLLTTDPFAPGELWRNDGDFSFAEVTETAFPGVIDPLLDGQGLTWADWDDDGDLDLFLAKGSRGVWEHATLAGDSLRWFAESATGELKTLVFTTEGDSVTIDAIAHDYHPVPCFAGAGGISLAEYPSTVAIVDVQGQPPQVGQGIQGVFVWSVLGAAEDTVLVQAGGPGASPLYVGGTVRANGPILDTLTVGYEGAPPYASRSWANRLYRNDAGTFVDVTAAAFAANDSTLNSKGAAWGDYDNDGHLDLYVANGGTVETGNQPNTLYRNAGDGTFQDVSESEGVTGSGRGMSDGAAWADVNGDGFLDLYVEHGAEHPPFGVGPRELFLNGGNANHWIVVSLRGLASSGCGIGARLRFVTASGTRFRTRLGESDNGFTNDPAIHVGLGADTVVDTLRVDWPSGKVDVHTGIPADARYVVVEGEFVVPAANPDLVASPAAVADTVAFGDVASWDVELSNPGGLAVDWSARIEGDEGEASWLVADPAASSVFPVGVGTIRLTASSAGLADGLHTARVVLESNGVGGPDTVRVALTVTASAVAAGFPEGEPTELALGQPSPNPSNGPVLLRLALPRDEEVTVSVHDLAGRRVSELFSGRPGAGVHVVHWSGRSEAGSRVASGVYLIRAVTPGATVVRRVVLRN